MLTDNEIFVGGWYLIGECNPHHGELAYVRAMSSSNNYVEMFNCRSFECCKDDLLPIKAKPEYLLENGWGLIDTDPDDGSKCYGIDVGDRYYLDWWEPTKKFEPGMLAIGWDAPESFPIEIPGIDEVHKIQQMLLFWGYTKQFLISKFLPQFKHSENEAKKDVNKKKHKHKH